MLRLDISDEALKFFDGLDTKRFKQVVNKIFSLLSNPRPHDSELLSGLPYFRADIGECRIVYRFDKEAVYVVVVGKRGDDVYKQLMRKA